MKKLFIIILLFPMAGYSQCPKWVNEPLSETRAFMGLLEQRLSFKFSDSSVSPERDRLIFNDMHAKYIITVEMKQDSVKKITFESSPGEMNVFVDWFKRAFEDCIISENDQTIVLPYSVAVLVNAIDNSKKYFYLSERQPAK